MGRGVGGGMEQDCQPPSPGWRGPSNLVDQGKPSLKRDRLRCNADMRPLALPQLGALETKAAELAVGTTRACLGEKSQLQLPRGETAIRGPLLQCHPHRPALPSVGAAGGGAGIYLPVPVPNKAEKVVCWFNRGKTRLLAVCRVRLSADRRHRRSVARTSNPHLRGANGAPTSE
jgi:hypothetical protein